MDNIFIIKERILHLIKYKGFTIEDFCEKIGITYGNLKGKAKGTPINSNSIANIFTLIPDLNLEWLISGAGEMFKGSEKPLVGAATYGECPSCEKLKDEIVNLKKIIELQDKLLKKV